MTLYLARVTSITDDSVVYIIALPKLVENESLKLPYYMKFPRHVYFAILMCAYFATLKFRNFAKILYFESLQFRAFEYNNLRFHRQCYLTCL